MGDLAAAAALGQPAQPPALTQRQVIQTMPHPQYPQHPGIPPMGGPAAAAALGQPGQPPAVTQRQVTYQTGEVYIGQWLQVSPTLGYPHGWGRKFGNSEYYEGQWHDGLKHGQGTRIWSSGEKYEGGWKENKRRGDGVQMYVDGSTYEGGWNDDMECGWGKKTKPNGEVYSGGFCYGKEVGWAIREHSDGRRYEGGIKDGKANGYGVGAFKDGGHIECGWKDGKAQGWGTEVVGTLKHVGNFEAGFWNGPGEQTLGKTVTKGIWAKGKLVKKPAEEIEQKGVEKAKSMNIRNDTYAWTTGRNAGVKHVKKVAVGGYGEVHEMLDTKLNQAFARKIIRPFGRVNYTHIETEIRAITELSNAGGHANLVKILRHGSLGHRTDYYIDMELCHMNLKDYIYGQRPLDLSAGTLEDRAFVHHDASSTDKMMNIWTVILHISAGIDFIHVRQQIHRDLKPENILFSFPEKLWKIADFGCTVHGTALTARTTVDSRGTASYRAPELVSDTPTYTAKVDIWALGCILYELTCGEPAFLSDYDTKWFRAEDTKRVSNTLFSDDFLAEVSAIVGGLLARDWRRRPDIATIINKVDLYRQALSTEINGGEHKLQENHDPYTPKDDDPPEILCWKEFINKYPDNLGLRKQLADAYQNRGQMELAVVVRRKMSEVVKHPFDEQYAQLRTAALEKSSDARITALSWESLLDMHADAWFLPDNLSKAFRQSGTATEEISYWKMLLDTEPKKYAAKWRTLLMDAYIRVDRAAGVTLWKKMLQEVSSPDEVDGLCYEMQKLLGPTADSDEVLAFWKGLVEKHPNQQKMAEQLEEAYKSRPRYDAIKFWKALLDQVPNSIVLPNCLAKAYQSIGETDKAIQCWLTHAQPEKIEWQTRLEEAFQVLGNVNLEVETWKGLVETYPDINSLQYKLAMAYSRTMVRLTMS